MTKNNVGNSHRYLFKELPGIHHSFQLPLSNIANLIINKKSIPVNICISMLNKNIGSAISVINFHSLSYGDIALMITGKSGAIRDDCPDIFWSVKTSYTDGWSCLVISICCLLRMTFA